MSTQLSHALRRALITRLTILACLALLAGIAFTGPAHAGSPQVITDGGQYPYTAVVHLYSTFPDDEVFLDSGVMIDRFHVLTCGHAVYNARHGGWASQIDVYAGESGSDRPFEVAHSTLMRTFGTFMDEDDASENGCHSVGNGDIGLVTLDRTLGDETGWFGWVFNNDDSFFEGRTLETIGYPGGDDYGGQMVHQGGAIIGAVGGAAGFGGLQWSLDSMTSIPGQSGSCLFDPETGLIYGVLDLGDGEYGYGERITEEVFNTLGQWCDEDPVPE
jgi:V8-like Glu-specific endopeptidase